jgi:hypothetical protein
MTNDKKTAETTKSAVKLNVEEVRALRAKKPVLRTKIVGGCGWVDGGPC